MNTLKEKPLVSVIMPSYNHEQFVCEAIDSVLNQTYQNFEILIVDDASTDRTADVIKTYKDSRIKAAFAKENRGFACNHGRCLEMATGDYCCYLATDDCWLPEKLEKQLAVFEDNPELGAVFTHTYCVDSSSKHIPEAHAEKVFHQRNRSREEWLAFFFFLGNTLSASSAMVLTKVYKKIASEDVMAPFKCLPDFAGWVQLLKENSIFIIQEDLTVCRIRNDFGNISAVKDERDRKILSDEYFTVREHFFEGISDELFINAFRPYMINKNARTVEQLKCEKAFLYLINKSFNGCVSANARMFELFRSKKTRDILEQDYDFTLNDYNELKATAQGFEKDGKPFSKRFEEMLVYFKDPDNIIGILSTDSEHTALLMEFLAERNARAKCMISLEPQTTPGSGETPLVTLEQSIRVIGVNTVIIGSYTSQLELYCKISFLEKHGVKVVRMFSTAEVLLDKFH